MKALIRTTRHVYEIDDYQRKKKILKISNEKSKQPTKEKVSEGYWVSKRTL